MRPFLPVTAARASSIVRRLKALCPTIGKVKIAQTLARAGLHLGAATVGRIFYKKPRPLLPTPKGVADPANRVMTAKYPNIPTSPVQRRGDRRLGQ